MTDKFEVVGVCFNVEVVVTCEDGEGGFVGGFVVKLLTMADVNDVVICTLEMEEGSDVICCIDK